MKKIVVDKGEGVAEVIDRVLAAADADIVLVIPKGSALVKSASNFRLLKREAGLAEKKIAVESVDDDVIQLAASNGISRHEATKQHPHGGAVSDIVAKTDDDEPASAHHVKNQAGIKLTVHAEVEKSDDEDRKSSFARDRFFQSRTVPLLRHNDEDDEDDENEVSRGGSGKAIAWTIGILVVLAAAFYGVTVIFGRAQVTIDFTQTPWSYQNNFIADKSVATTTPDSTDGGTGNATAIPAQVFTTQKNITQLFPATGQTSNGSAKAQGTITVYNDYGAAPQQLVATTRFVTPDGKIFRLVNDITVPGATVAADGTITPTSIDAPIIADQGGPAYDVGPVSKLVIPGFQSNAGKYAGFYGEIRGQTTGGSTTGRPVPTSADITAAKASTTAILEADLQDGFAASYPNNFKILDGATDVQITKLTVSTSTDANGNFSVFGEASLTAIGFDESALQAYLLGLAQNQVQSQVQGAAAGGMTTMAFKNFAEPNYSNVQASFSKGQVSFSVSAQETLEPAFSADQFATAIAGESIGTARDAIQNLPELSDGRISVWPVWLWKMPGDQNKIQISVN